MLLEKRNFQLRATAKVDWFFVPPHPGLYSIPKPTHRYGFAFARLRVG
jgi:hypothetical protein